MIMSLRYDLLSGSPQVFRTMAGMTVAEFDALCEGILPRLREDDLVRRRREGRRRAPGGGHPFQLSARDQLLLTLVRDRHQTTYDVLAYLFSVSRTTVVRTIARIRPLLGPVPSRVDRAMPGRARP